MLYVMPEPVGVLTVIVPVELEHVGCVTVSVGTEGAVGCGFMVFETAVDKQFDVVLLVTTEYVPAFKAFDVAEAWNVVPLSKLYVTPLDGAVTVIVPVATEHVGCTIVVVAAAIVGQMTVTALVHVPVPAVEVMVKVREPLTPVPS